VDPSASVDIGSISIRSSSINVSSGGPYSVIGTGYVEASVDSSIGQQHIGSIILEDSTVNASNETLGILARSGGSSWMKVLEHAYPAAIIGTGVQGNLGSTVIDSIDISDCAITVKGAVSAVGVGVTLSGAQSIGTISIDSSTFNTNTTGGNVIGGCVVN
jgi:hypothetical protein